MRYGFVAALIGALSSLSAHAAAADLKITDVGGASIELKDCAIDYTRYSMFYTPDVVKNGIRAYLGDGIVTIIWPRISRIEILGIKRDRMPYRLTAKLTMTDGTARDMELVTDSEKELRGQWAASEFSIVIPLGKVRLIEVTKAN
jgi:hypothetical protein